MLELVNKNSSLLVEAESLLKGMARRDAVAIRRMQQLFPRLKRIADGGDPDFQSIVAGLALEYMGKPQIALTYFRAAADVGHAAGQRGLAHMLINGIGVERNEKMAADLFRSAAAAGDAFAKHNLAGMYLRGVGVDEDRGRAIALLTAASREGVDAASRTLGEIEASEGNHSKAREYYELAAAQGSYRVLIQLGVMFRDGVGGPVDQVQAVKCFLRLLDIGYGDGLHEARSVSRSMSDRDIREAARLAGRPSEGEVLIKGKLRDS
ncbi:hypothetical protein GCM10020367_18540 [Streptomyces sannanensis]|uniref:Sel1 repeat family protein n=1 Tax=Streptomyces sannanensis TaxID=285536 RepID=A0ABP6S8C9_9ACTN